MNKIIVILTVFALAYAAYGEAQDAASRERSRILIDTNATTTVTAYTAAGAGQLLVGRTASSNSVWIATAAGTNYWQRIAISAP